MSKKRNLSIPTLFGYSIIHPFNIILLLNCSIYLLQLFVSKPLLFQFALIPELIMEHGKFWQLFTYGFLHSSEGFFPFHLLLNMYGFYMLSRMLEEVMGKWKITLIYFLSQLGGGLLVLLVSLLMKHSMDPFQDQSLTMYNIPTIGASGAVFGLLSVFSLIFPEMELYILFFRVQARNVVWVSLLIGFVLELFLSAHISNFCHLGGALTGYLIFYIYRKKSILLQANRLPPEFSKTSAENKNEPFQQFLKNNEALLNEAKNINNPDERIEFIQNHTIPNANICPPDSYNETDEYCKRCEWLANCLLREELKK